MAVNIGATWRIRLHPRVWRWRGLITSYFDHSLFLRKLLVLLWTRRRQVIYFSLCEDAMQNWSSLDTTVVICSDIIIAVRCDFYNYYIVIYTSYGANLYIHHCAYITMTASIRNESISSTNIVSLTSLRSVRQCNIIQFLLTTNQHH